MRLKGPSLQCTPNFIHQDKAHRERESVPCLAHLCMHAKHVTSILLSFHDTPRPCASYDFLLACWMSPYLPVQ